MPKIVRTARGEMVDFDLIRIKQQLADAPAPTEVRERENFVERRLKRKLKQRATSLVDQPAAVETKPEGEVTEAEPQVEAKPETKPETAAPKTKERK